MNSLERKRVLARLFTRPTFASLGRPGGVQQILKLLKSTGALSSGRTRSVVSIFEAAFEEIRIAYRNEYVYKTAIANKIVFGKHSPRTASLHIELPIGRSIVDAAVFNGTSTAYEIKTEFDSAKRIFSQTADYLRAFEFVYVVTHPALADRYLNAIDRRVGIYVATEDDRLSLLRPAQSNLRQTDPVAIFRTLRRAEYLQALKELGEVPDLPNGLIAGYCETLFKKLPNEDAHEIFVKALRKRTTDPESVAYLDSLSPCLRVLGYATPASKRQQEQTITSLQERVQFSIA